MGKMSIQVKDAKGAKASMIEMLTSVEDLAVIAGLAKDLDSYTCAKVETASITKSANVEGGLAFEEGPYCLVNNKAVLTFRDTEATGSKGPACVLRIPAPDADLFEMGENGSFVVKPAMGASIASMINTRLGRKLEFVRGILWSKKGKKH